MSASNLSLATARRTIIRGVKDQGNPLLVMLMGLPGAGKSTLAAHIHQRHGLSVLSGEAVTVALFGTDRCSKDQYAEAYRVLQELMKDLLRDGYGVVIDGTNLRAQHRQQIYDAAEGLTSNIVLLHLEVNDATALARAGNRVKDESARGETGYSQDTFNKFKAQFEPPRKEVAAVFEIDANTGLFSRVDSILGKYGKV